MLAYSLQSACSECVSCPMQTLHLISIRLRIVLRNNIKHLKMHLISVVQFLDAHSTFEEKLHDDKKTFI